MYAYDETRNLIEVRGRGVKIFTLLLDHNLSYVDNTCYEKLLCSTSSTAVRIYIGKTVHLVSFLADAIMRTICVGTVSISITYMAIIVAFINIYENNLFAKGNWLEKKMLNSLLDNKTIICDEQLFSFFQNLI